MEILYATFQVEVSDSEYSFQGHRGQAEVKIQVTRSILESIDPGNLFIGAMQAALANFDKSKEGNNMDIAQIPRAELLTDKRASLDDIKVCLRALAIGIEEYSGGKVQSRIDGNYKIISAIDRELEKRKGVMEMQEFINAYADCNMPYEDALELANQRDKEAARDFLLSLEIGAAVRARMEKNA